MADDLEKLPPLEQGILRAMKALDRQILREMQRTPAEREEKGVQKWEPIDTRIELVTSFVLNVLGEGEVELDSLLVMSQAMTKALRFVVHDLERDGLGELRTTYCQQALERISKDADDGARVLKDEAPLM